MSEERTRYLELIQTELAKAELRELDIIWRILCGMAR